MKQYPIDSEDRRKYPMGLTKTKEGIHVAVTAAAASCSLLLFLPGKGRTGLKKEAVRIPFPESGHWGDVWEMTVQGEDLDQYLYAFEANGVRFSDPCGRSFLGREQWGKLETASALLTTPIHEETFDWEGDTPLRIPYEESVVYRAHVRGLTRHSSSGGEERGTFRGVTEKIPYLKSLGVTTLELLPVNEFSEIMMPERALGNPYGAEEPTGKLNYWGYAPAYLYAPKASYAGKGRNPVTEFKTLVKELHKAGIELVTEVYISGREKPVQALEAVRFWVREYHLDGVHLVGQPPLALIESDPYLADTKLWAVSWEQKAAPGRKKRLGEYNEGFLVDMRRVLKGDEDQMSPLAFRTRKNPAECGVINFLAGTNGFTMADMVSYEQKHNEANGEGNRDGSSYNHTWNCGAEGPVRKKKILQLRRRQLRNALLLLFLSQGTPMLLAGDEFGNSQGGNNNAYCQDNETSWLNWNLKKGQQEQLAFVKYLIRFRREHPVFHMEQEPRVMDYLACGHPDISYHGVHAWRPEYENFRRQLGILYCGEYAKKPDGTKDSYFFVAYNMHWEPHVFDLPNLPRGQQWQIAFDTSDDEANGFYIDGEERKISSQKNHTIPPRAIVVFVGKQPQQLPALEKGKVQPEKTLTK